VPKKIDNNALIGDAGIALIHGIVNQMGLIWRTKDTFDAGIDGEIEIRDQATGEVSNRRLLVQSKASDGRFPSENDDSFHYRCSANDVDYWMNADAPVVLVCSHPASGEAWWAHVQGWLADPSRRASRQIHFDKATQRFEPDAAQQLVTLADPHGHVQSPIPTGRPERIESNLLPVTPPPMIFLSPTPAADDKTIHEQLRAADGHRLDWLRHGGRLLTFHDPADSVLKRLVSGKAETIETTSFAQRGPTEERLVIWLLNNTLKQDTSADLHWDRESHYLYFRATDNLQVRKILSSTGRPRIVFQPKLNRQGKVSYYQHLALESQFILIGDDLFCELVSNYHYTRDGTIESSLSSSLRSGIKRIEKNSAVLGQVRMWANYLRGGDTLLETPPRVLKFGELVTFATEYGIDDDAWRPNGTIAAASEAAEPTLFDEEL
jgi:hypothetical protein